MKTRILCFGASNTWGFKPGSFDLKTELAERYDENERWPMLLGQILPQAVIIEEGLNGRTTAFDDSFAQKPYRNGLMQLPICLEAHYPLDWVIIMLGTNDVKVQYKKTPEEITAGMSALLDCVLSSNKGREGKPPKVLLIAPQPLHSAALSSCFDKISLGKSVVLPTFYKRLAKQKGCAFLDLSSKTNAIESSAVDGIHLEVRQHKKLAKFVAGVLKKYEVSQVKQKPFQAGQYKNVYQFKISLNGIKPSIWRRIQVPETYTFWDLHVAIQDVMGWLDCHLHEFNIHNPRTRKEDSIGIPDEDSELMGMALLPGWEVPIRAYFSENNKRAIYAYDFGDNWEHTICLEAILPRESKAQYPICLEGARACPPEDCGSIPGYERLVEVMKNPRSEEYEGMREWLGKAYDPEEFNTRISFSDPKEALSTRLDWQ